MNKVSVIVPIFNAEKYLSACIESIINQDYSNLEIILIDDGSNDKSFSIVKSYEKNDERIIAVSTANSGVSAARNLGIKMATGDYICFVDSDDYILPSLIHVLVESVESHSVDAVFSGMSLCYDNKIVEKPNRLKQGIYAIGDVSQQLYDDGTLTGILLGSSCGSLYKRSIVNNNDVLFNVDLKKNEDGFFNIEYLMNSNALYFVDLHLYMYRQWKHNEKMVSLPPFNTSLLSIDALMKKYEANIHNLSLQLERRYVSVGFWYFLRLKDVDVPFWKISKTVRSNEFMTEYLRIANFETLNYKRMTIYKKVMIGLLKHKKIMLFTILLRYIKPLLEKVVKH